VTVSPHDERSSCQTGFMTTGRSALICRCLLANTLTTVDDCLCRS